MDNKKIGLFLKEIRTSKGLYEDEVAEKIGCLTFELICWEDGEASPPIKFLLPLAEIYEISVDEILNAEIDSSMPLISLDNDGESNTEINKIVFSKMENMCDDADNSDEIETQCNTESEYNDLNIATRATEKSIQKNQEISVERNKNLNGFSKEELWFGYAVCIIFLILIIAFTSVHIKSDMEGFSLDNYSEYVTIDVRNVNVFNNTEYKVVVTAKDDIQNFSLKIIVTFNRLDITNSNNYPNQETKEILFDAGNMSKDDVFTRAFSSSHYSYTSYKTEIISIQGDLI